MHTQFHPVLIICKILRLLGAFPYSIKTGQCKRQGYQKQRGSVSVNEESPSTATIYTETSIQADNDNGGCFILFIEHSAISSDRSYLTPDSCECDCNYCRSEENLYSHLSWKIVRTGDAHGTAQWLSEIEQSAINFHVAIISDGYILRDIILCWSPALQRNICRKYTAGLFNVRNYIFGNRFLRGPLFRMAYCTVTKTSEMLLDVTLRNYYGKIKQSINEIGVNDENKTPFLVKGQESGRIHVEYDRNRNTDNNNIYSSGESNICAIIIETDKIREKLIKYASFPVLLDLVQYLFAAIAYTFMVMTTNESAMYLVIQVMAMMKVVLILCSTDSLAIKVGISFYHQGSPQWINRLHIALSPWSSSVTIHTLMVSLTTFIILFGIPFSFQPSTSILSLFLSTYLSSFLSTCPNHLRLAFFTTSTNHPICAATLRLYNH
ncbi:hypothetical protein SK128_007907 [Halocaridina rubra]|uniref:Odorant receptor n=1 Tax=Halocaridina rubra TaxID=373956 RepID=A0AAN8WPD7_HALRR